MKRYHVASGNGEAYYGCGYESYSEAKELLKISKRHDPQAYIVEEEYHFTNADHIRAMTDFELMEFLWKLDNRDLGEVIKFCGKSHVCDELDVDEITEGMCQRCLLAKLQQPYEREEIS